MRYIRILGLVLVVGMATVAAQGMKGKAAQRYDAAKEITIQGTVEDITAGGRGMMAGTHITVKTEDKNYVVALGPTWFLDEKKFAIAKGDQVELTGAPYRMMMVDLIARKIKTGEVSLELRDTNGMPLWAGHRHAAHP